MTDTDSIGQTPSSLERYLVCIILFTFVFYARKELGIPYLLTRGRAPGPNWGICPKPRYVLPQTVALDSAYMRWKVVDID